MRGRYPSSMATDRARLVLEVEVAEHLPVLSPRTVKQALFASSIVQGGGKRRGGGVTAAGIRHDPQFLRS